MKYTKTGKDEFIENGKSKLRVQTAQMMVSPTTPGRVLKVMSVQQVISGNPNNPINVGNAIVVSFPEQAANAHEYEWHATEEKLVPMQINDPKKIIEPPQDLALL